MFRRLLALLLCSACPVLVLSLGSGPVLAQPMVPLERQFIEEARRGEPRERDCLFQPFLHGRDGLQAEYLYIGEVFTNTRGGINTKNATRYKGNFDLLLTANLDQLDLFPGGIVYLYGNHGHGRGITEDFVGDYQGISNIDGLNTMQVAEFWWEIPLLDEFLRVRLGKQDANHDFAVVELAEDFINGSYGQHPNIPMPSWPDGAMGVATFFQLADRLELRAGVWDGVADGRTWGFSGTGETITMLEVKTQYELPDALPGEFHAGVWYHGGPFGDLDGSPIRTGNHGAYLGAQQAVFREGGHEEDDQGLDVFVQYGWSREDRSEVPHYVGGGLVYRGLLPNRDKDLVGVAIAHAVFSDLLVDQSAETNIELFYKLRLAPYFVIQPDLQYVASPNGMHRDALVAGLRFEVDL